MFDSKKIIYVRYYALLRDERGCEVETLTTAATTPLELYKNLQEQYKFRLSPELLRVAINDTFVLWTQPLKNNDTVVFIPPVSGG